MKYYSAFALTAAALLSLSACGQQAETSVPADSSAAAASAPAGDALQTLTSSDGNIRILVQGGRFEEADKNTAALPANVNADELTLLQNDSSRDITLYAVNLGAAKTDAKTYFANLKSALDAAEGLQDAQSGAATTTRMNYRFTQTDADGNTLRENCIAIHETNIYNVCANSSTASQEALSAVLKDVNLVK
ncbi:cytochrome C [Uruburuella testudinis]|uniref:Cytochrome C n=1 Tax=Uruburuella testudinis TaxID=1282863 RepID=A0ABY4DTL1_9NEIS|nr:cytochrome C [Uruburuella testudinis]UOO82383.1 cytochrome C [Uruburuella testudinis]